MTYKVPTDEPTDIIDRDWPVERIVDKQVDPLGSVKYLVRWENYVLPQKDIRLRADGRDCVRCDGKDFEILTDREASPEAESGRPQREIRWKDEWRGREQLEKARGAIEDYEKLVRQQRLPGMATPPGSDFQASPEPIDIAAGDGAEHLVSNISGTALKLQLQVRPDKGVDYSHCIRSMFPRPSEGCTITTTQSLLSNRPVRPLLVRDKFVDDGKILQVKRLEKRRTALSQDCGYEQLAECDRCRVGCGPFTKCIVGDVFRGAYANCVYTGLGKHCNFHSERELQFSLDKHPC